MGFEDRDYYRDEDQPSMFKGGGAGGGGFGGGGGMLGGRLGSAPVTKWLLITCAAIFLLDSILFGSQRASMLSPMTWGLLSIEQGVYRFQIWRFFTAIFLHANFMHVFFNCLGLFFFGPLIEQWWGGKRFLAFFIICGLFGNILFVLLALGVPGLLFPSGLDPRVASIVGASGGLFGILAASAYLFPKMRVMLLIPPIPMTMRTMALIFLGLAALSLIAGADNAGGDAAHLGGAVVGWLLVMYPSILAWADRVSPEAIQQGYNKGRFERKKKQEVSHRAEVDRILDKVKDKGLSSLTSKEKRTLQKETEKQSGR